MSTNLANGQEHFNSFVKQELDKTIAVINEHNNGTILTDTLSYFNQEQKNRFVNLVKQYYGKLLQSLHNQTNEGLIKYDSTTQNFIIPIVEENIDGTTKTIDCKLTVEQFILIIIHAIAIAVFKLDGNYFFTTFRDNTSALTSVPELENKYPFITSFVLNEMLRDPNFASGLTLLADNVATGSNTSRSRTYVVTLEKPLPPTPRNGWPSDRRRGGKTNRKRKYKSRSNSRSTSKSKSSSRKRNYKYRRPSKRSKR
jgi:hypothetical protein